MFQSHIFRHLKKRSDFQENLAIYLLKKQVLTFILESQNLFIFKDCVLKVYTEYCHSSVIFGCSSFSPFCFSAFSGTSGSLIILKFTTEWWGFWYSGSGVLSFPTSSLFPSFPLPSVLNQNSSQTKDWCWWSCARTQRGWVYGTRVDHRGSRRCPAAGWRKVSILRTAGVTPSPHSLIHPSSVLSLLPSQRSTSAGRADSSLLCPSLPFHSSLNLYRVVLNHRDGLTLSGGQVPLYHSPSQLDMGEKIWWKPCGSR